MDSVLTTLLVSPVRLLAPQRVLVLGVPTTRTLAALLAVTRPCGSEVHLVTSSQVRFQANQWPSQDTARLTMHTPPSRSVLAAAGPFDLALVDVEPNWWTVARALRAVVDTSIEGGAGLPVLLVPNAGWPHHNRDAYAAPDQLPEDSRQPHAAGGLHVGRPDLDSEGGFDPLRFHAVTPGGPRNGVATGVSDGLQHVRDRYDNAVIPGFHGLAVLWPKALASARPEAVDALRSLRVDGPMRTYLERLEVARLQAETARLDLGGVDAAGPIPRGIKAEDRKPADIPPLVQALLERSRGPEAVRLLRDALVQHEGDVQLWALLARTLLRLNNAPGALDAIRKAHELAPDDIGLALEHGQIASRVPGQEPEAEATIRGVLTLDRDHLRAQVLLASHLRLVGELAEAEGLCQSVIAKDPDNLSALATLAHLGGLTPDQLERADHLSASTRMNSHERSNVHFALAQSFDRVGEYELAIGHARRANDLSKVLFQTSQGAAFDPVAHRAQVDELITTFDRELIESLAVNGSPSRLPIVIGGLPRSGTTLTEQILASHPEVFGAGEVGELGRTVREINRRADGPVLYPAAMAALTPEAVTELSSELLTRFAAHAPDAAHVTDKLPMNFLQLGLCAVLLPEAPMFTLRRDPRDVFISSYFQGFSSPGLAYTNDQSWFAAYAREHDRIMAHWREVLPQLLEVDYAELTADQEGWSRRIIAHAGLDWNPACLDFHTTKRAIHTASATQVRQPMYSSSVQRWRNYEPWIDELLTGLEQPIEDEPELALD